MKPALQRLDRRRILTEVGLLTAMGLIVGELGPFGTDAIPTFRRHAYWFLCIVGGGLIGTGLDALVATRIADQWRRLPATVLGMTPLVTAYVIGVSWILFGYRRGLGDVLLLAWQVLIVSLAIMTARTLVWRAPKRVVETHTIVAPPLPEAEAAFRRRLSARRRTARLIAVEAYDHYLRVHTDAGEELITARFADALEELERAHGFRTHRSWWVAADAIEAVQWRRGGGEARLACGVTSPISRTYAPTLRSAGWF
jgi:hypothetical protein